MSGASFAMATIRPTIKMHRLQRNTKTNLSTTEKQTRRPTPIIHQTWHIIICRAHITTAVRDRHFKYPTNTLPTTANPPTNK